MFESELDRLISKIVFADNGCWLYDGRLDRDGYGLFWFVDETRRAHRVSYQLHIGVIPDSMVLDHTCHDPETCYGGKECVHRRCINPDHLVPLRDGDNTRSDRRVPITPEGRASKAAIHAAKTHCNYGHEYTLDNIRIRPSTGTRDCKQCLRDRSRNARRGMYELVNAAAARQEME